MTRIHLLSSLAVASVLVTGWSADASAQVHVGRFAIDRFDPSQRGSRWFTLESLDYANELRPALGVVGDLGYGQMKLNDNAGHSYYVVKDQIAFHLGASMTFWQRLRVDLSLPVYAWAWGESMVRFDGIYKGPDNGGAGDLRIGANVLAVGAPKDAFRVGLGVRLWAPSGSPDNYAGDGTASFQAHADVAGDVSAFVYAARLGYRYRGVKETFGPTNIGDEIPFGVSVGMKFLDDTLLVGPELQGAIEISDTEQNLRIPNKRSIPVYGILGAHYTTGDVQLGAGFGPGLSGASGTAAFRGLVSVEWVPTPKVAVAVGPGDSDGDGIADDKDACKDQAGVPSDDPAKNGCPAAAPVAAPAPGVVQDKDNDGIPDPEDACPAQAGVKDADPKKNGCPAAAADKDGDGIEDAKDACPGVAGPPNVDQYQNGCPADTDGDGIVDNEDACPTQTGPKNADPKQNGCPAGVGTKASSKPAAR
jgi:OmpA-OmpF porin, OOP family